ncbi:MAG: hypothetical protein GF409_00450 [Candidatus Omnitrophica bacterium]|nr:hypothetical protein [Candidatus Omnitrophota bacterium]
MQQIQTNLTEVIDRAPGVKSFRFGIDKRIEFKAGQYFFVKIDVGGAGMEKPFSFSNSPTEEGYAEFTKRLTGSDFSKALDRMKPGARASLRMPYGKFTLEEDRKIAFLSGGIGITPVRSMAKYATDSKLPTEMVLIYGNNTEEDIIFREDLDRMAEVNDKFQVVYTLTAPDVCPVSEQCRRGLIDAEMIKEEIPDYTQRVFYICGPPGMLKGLRKVLCEDLALGEDTIRTEQFSGYN